MASSICFYTIIYVFLFCRSINGENKEETQKEKRQTFPNFNEISLAPSGGTNFLYDLLGLRSIPSLDYTIPTLQLPLKLAQNSPDVSENNPDLKTTPRPAPPLPPPPSTILSKQQNIPINHYIQPTAVPFKPPFETLHYPQYQVAETPKLVPVAAVGYKKQQTPLNHRQAVPQFIIIRRPLPSIDNLRQLPAPQQPQAHPLQPPRQNIPIIYAGPPRVAIHENYNLQEVPVNQGAPTIIKPQDSQVTQNEQIIRGPRYYLPQPTKGNEGYFGPFQFAPGSFDALLKSDVSFLDHLSGNVNKSDHPQSSVKDESYNIHDIPSPPSPPPPAPPSEHQPSINEKYYKPQHPNTYSSERSRNPHINSGHSSQTVEDKEQAYHKPIPIQNSEVNEDKDKPLDLNLFDHRYLPQQPSQVQYTDRNPIGPIYRIIPQSNPNPVAFHAHPVNNYRRPVQYAAAVQPNAHVLPVAYRPEVQQNYPAQLPYRQEIQSTPYVSYRPEVQPQIHQANTVPNFRQPYPNPSQALVNQDYAAIPNHAINQPKITVVSSRPSGYTRGRSASGHIAENLENHKTEAQRPEIRDEHLKYERENYDNLQKYNSGNSQKFEDDRSEKNRDYDEDSESTQQSSNDYDKNDDKPEHYRSYQNKENYKPQEELRNHEDHRFNSNTRSRDIEDDDEPFDDESSSHRRSKRQIMKQYQASSNDPSVVKVFSAIAINDTDGVLVDERYVRDKEGKPIHLYTQAQPITYSDSSTEAAQNYEIPVPGEASKDAYATPSDAVTATPKTESAIVQEVRVNVNDDDKPDCAKNSNIPICTSDDQYPKERILKVLSQESNFISKLSGVTALFNSNNATTNGQVPPIAETSWNNICPSVLSHITPYRARNLKGEWKIIVNVEEVKQNLNVETCLKIGERCNLVPLQFKTQCDQKYAILHLLTYDEKNGLMIDQFLVPAACSCSVAKSNK